MKNKIWTFGDSYTAGILPDLNHFPPYIEYMNYLGISKEEFPEGWAYQLASKFDFDLEVHAVGGTSNEETLIRLYQNIPNFKKDDIVIVQWSYMNRFLWANSEENYVPWNIVGNPFGTFKRASIHTETNKDYEFTPTETFKHIGINKSLPSWIIQINSFENLLKYISNVVGFNIFFWSSDDTIVLSKKDEMVNDNTYLLGKIVNDFIEKIKGTNIENAGNIFLESIRELGATSIYQETNGTVQDRYHLGIEGNKVMCNLLYNHIKNHLDNSK